MVLLGLLGSWLCLQFNVCLTCVALLILLLLWLAGKQTGIFGQIVAAMQAWMMRVIQQHGFFGILLLASWPNAAFDLCGICCGAFLMPFWEFFGATLIGKGVIKVSGQSLFFVALFRYAVGLTICKQA